MNEFKESLKVSKEQLEYEEYKRKRFAKEIHKEKWDNARKRLITAILVILALIICFMSWDTAVKYEALNKDKQALEDITEMQRSMISDLEENCRDLYIENEKLKFGGNE